MIQDERLLLVVFLCDYHSVRAGIFSLTVSFIPSSFATPAQICSGERNKR